MVKGKKVTVSEASDAQPQPDDAAEVQPTEEEAEVPSQAAPDENERDAEESAQRLEKAEEAAKENYERFLRVSAEFDNYKKRTAREMEEFKKFSTEKLIKELLPVVDNLERALVSTDDPSVQENGIKEGVDLTLQEILRVLERFGVKSIQSLNEPFDPTFHQAMMQEPRDNVPGNTVISELQKGYTLHDRLLRPAMVIVSTPTAAPESDAGEPG
jgi:molecular chaperone GrpE